jgi:NADH-quinone oxidoreductase subunit J
MTLVQLVFLLTAAVMLVASFLVVTSRRLIHAGLWLILVMAGVAVMLVLLEASFLAAVEVLVYIGAISILIIFAVMLTRRVMDDTDPQSTRLWWVAGLVSLVLLGTLMALFTRVPVLLAVPAELPADQATVLSDLGRSLVDANRFVLPFEVASILLLAAMVGAIFIARPETTVEGGQEE